MDARGLRDPHRGPAHTRGRRGGDSRLLSRDPPGRDRRRDRQLPQAAVHAVRGQQRAHRSPDPGRGRPRRRAVRVRVLLDGVRARHRVPHHRGAPRQLPGAALRLRVLEAGRRDLHPRRERGARPALHDLPPVQRLRARRASRARRAGDRPRRARSDPQGADRPAAARDLRCGEQTRTITHVDDIADGIVTAMASPAGENEDFNVSASEELTVAELAEIIWEACGNDPASSSSPTCRASRSTCSGAGRRSRRRDGCWGGKRRSTSATASPRPWRGYASRRPRAPSTPSRRPQHRRRYVSVRHAGSTVEPRHWTFWLNPAILSHLSGPPGPH